MEKVVPMTGSEITHQPCPYEECGSSDAFSYNTEGFGKCHSCNRAYPSTATMFDWAKETYPVKKKVDLKSAKVLRASFTGVRGLDEDVARLYGIYLAYGEDDYPLYYAFKYPNNVKYRGYHEKKFWYKEHGSITDLFGPEFNAGSSNRLYITEGEFDAASLYQVLGRSYPVKSIPSAAISEKFIKKNYEYLNSFKEVVYAGELDEAG